MNFVNMYLKGEGYQPVANMVPPFIIDNKINLYKIYGAPTGKILGKGTYGMVYDTKTGYAIKKMAAIKNDISGSNMREVAVLRYLHHPNIIDIDGVYVKENGDMSLVMNLAQGTMDVHAGYSLLQRKSIFYQLFRAIAYSHSQYVWHRDIKPQNVLMYEQGVVKLADFGLASVYLNPNNTIKNLNVITLWWRSPEILLGNTKYSDKADVWSLAVMLLDAIVGDYALVALNENEELEKIFDLLGKPTEQQEQNITKYLATAPIPAASRNRVALTLDALLTKHQSPPEEQAFLKQILTWSTSRITALEALDDPYFNKVRDNIEQTLPAPPIIHEECYELMYKQQKLIPTNVYDSYSARVKTVLPQSIAVWLLHVANNTEHLSSVYLAITIFNIYIRKTHTPVQQLQLVALASLNIAVKMVDEGQQLWLDQQTQIINNVTEEKLVETEVAILKTLQFNLVIPTIGNFLDVLIPNTLSKHNTKLIKIVSALLMTDFTLITTYMPSKLATMAIDFVILQQQLTIQENYCMKTYRNIRLTKKMYITIYNIVQAQAKRFRILKTLKSTNNTNLVAAASPTTPERELFFRELDEEDLLTRPVQNQIRQRLDYHDEQNTFHILASPGEFAVPPSPADSENVVMTAVPTDSPNTYSSPADSEDVVMTAVPTDSPNTYSSST